MPEKHSYPWGDAFIVQTPTLDRWGQQLYAEQKQRELRAYQENQAIDANIQKELGRVRSMDTPDVIGAYQKYKSLKKELLFNNSLKKDPIAYNKVQQDAALAYRDIYETANKSAEAKDLAKKMFETRLSKPNDFNDNSGQMIAALMSTPLGQLKNHPQFGDLTDPNNYMDMGMNTDWGKMMREAIGNTPKEVYSEKKDLPGGLQTEITPYMYANNPLQVKDYLMGSMGMRQAGKDAAKAWDKLSEDEIDKTIKAYQSLPKEYWQKMGLSGPQDLFPKNPDSKAENYASFLAMKDAVSRKPEPGKPQTVNNLKAIKDLDFERNKQMEAIKHANDKELAQFKKKIDPNDTDMNNVWYKAHLDNIIQEANTKKERRHVFTTGGKSLYYYNVIKPDPFTMKAFERNGREPNRIGITETGDIVPIFYKYDSKNEILKSSDGTPLIDDDSEPMSYEQALISLGYRGATKKQLSSDLKGIKNQSKHNDPLGLF